MRETAPDKLCREICLYNKKVANNLKYLPGKFLIAINDTNLSEFLTHLTVCRYDHPLEWGA